MLENKTLLITGGTGSFGNAVIDRLISTDVETIKVFSRDEKKQDDMRHHYQKAYPEYASKLEFYIGDVRDMDSLRIAMRSVDLVFHAAALKQVPSCEFFPIEAVKTNVLGTDMMLSAAIDAGVKKVICLSTDKAAYPINAMGMSKALMEKTLIAKSRTVSAERTTICATRYGNVLCSRGSVVPLFVEQIRNGQPLSVTDPDMTRFIMSLDEAIDLVLFAFEQKQTGDIMIQKAPACRIGDLARAIANIFDPRATINVIGTRHGEKKYEVLMTKEEATRAIDLGDFYRISADERGLNYESYLSSGSAAITEAVEYNSNNTRILSVDEIQSKLMEQDFIQTALRQWSTQR